jgi:hypothetical protein
MSIASFLRSFFSRRTRARLRNKPGGLAWIRIKDGSDGSHVLHGRVVTTVRLASDGLWDIEPPQSFFSAYPLCDSYGTRGPAGTRCDVDGLDDDCLQPIGAPGESEQDETLLWKPVPRLIPLKVREMTRE